ncbi:GerMN domain-containing protein [Zhihengliuella halotolerans]|uniref:Sporulation and spore germination protein n=1 Tax=Zhihengliuella halotolerans TaxID=370736 RepID=A0A4Q8ABF7_9MICC|nr:GerMN domain-containing protein [Zhihengliuella halotolerans]RZU61364.1 sporulation and spore germination protein [Zhihengliuella halotolerans]
MTTKPPARTRWIALPAIAAVALISGCTAAETEADVSASLSSMQASVPEALSLSESGRQENLSSRRLAPVYWSGRIDGEDRLYREFVQAEDQGDPITTSLYYMMANEPFDPDFTSVWNAEASIGTSISDDNTITVDVGPGAFAADVTPEQAELAVQQLVYTATAAAWTSGLLSEGAAPGVRLLIGGRTGQSAFDHVDLDRRLVRDAQLRAPVWIIDPQYGAKQKADSATLNGVAEEYPGGLHWKVAEAENPEQVVADGTFERDQLDGEAFSASIPLPPGIYEVTVWGIGSDGAEHGADTKHFTIGEG